MVTADPRRRLPSHELFAGLHLVAFPPAGSRYYRVIFKDNGVTIEVGSIGVQHQAGANAAWIWGIDTVIPMRCKRQFKAAWIMFASDEARLTEFLAAKRDIDDHARLRELFA